MLAHVVFLTVVSAAATRAEVIDRIAVILDNEAIPASEINREIRLTAFLNADDPDFSPEAKRKTAERLIDQRLIRREIDLGRYAQPAASDIEALLKQIQQRFHSAQEYHGALAKYGITEPELKAHLLWEITLIRFIELRFRAGVQVPEEDIRKYLDTHASRSEDKAGSESKSGALHDEAKEKLTEEQIDKQMDQWLKETRQRARIEFRPEAFR
jgi:peptidyl-prolyl cis-trans isomerase SurA